MPKAGLCNRRTMTLPMSAKNALNLSVWNRHDLLGWAPNVGFMWAWLNTYASAIQAITAVVGVAATIVLVCITARYVSLTKKNDRCSNGATTGTGRVGESQTQRVAGEHQPPGASSKDSAGSVPAEYGRHDDPHVDWVGRFRLRPIPT